MVGVKVGQKDRLQRGKVEAASAKADGDPRPQSITKTRSPTITADEIPARPATGIGAPAVPSRTSSVVMLTSLQFYRCALSTDSSP
jgi:hypothetical protein